MRHCLSLCLPAVLIGALLAGCAPEQDHYGVPPDLWKALTPEQQQLIATQATHTQPAGVAS